ncbi:hypothetical protein [Methylobacterium sp. WL8]|uniref:hypothetical protein n=1 Tax=Methylobacterium sp. WL8 TaxID=2603899 RepID=UPI0011CB7508|nr:hypothetical protein [Methylobacterium sp. WL8]TXN79298.1 hypothetical protein FV234_21060 [Methylobacterium sp. WL8]
MTSAAVVEQRVALATIEVDAGGRSAVAEQRTLVATVVVVQGLSGRNGTDGEDGTDGGLSEAQVQALIEAAMSNPPIATTDTSGTLVAGVVTSALPENDARQFIEITNTGANPMNYRFDADPTATAGHTIGVGGSRVFQGGSCPRGALRLFSEAGTTFFITTG